MEQISPSPPCPLSLNGRGARGEGLRNFHVTSVTDEGESILKVGQAVGFPAGQENGHCLYNHTDQIATYLEIGDRTPNDAVNYPDDDLIAIATEQGWQFTHKDGTPYSS